MVSIQPLLLFYSRRLVLLRKRMLVSIQPLLLFYMYNVCLCSLQISFQYNPCYCSMEEFRGCGVECTAFQYNPCYCSISLHSIQNLLTVCFNTTLVTVLFICSSFLIFVYKVSIQPLLLFYEFWSLGI